MSNNPAYDPTDPRYYDEKDLRSEEERIFSLCADCRLCVRYCGSFPKLFDAVDTYCTDEKYAEVDTKSSRPTISTKSSISVSNASFATSNVLTLPAITSGPSTFPG